MHSTPQHLLSSLPLTMALEHGMQLLNCTMQLVRQTKQACGAHELVGSCVTELHPTVMPQDSLAGSEWRYRYMEWLNTWGL
jgi:hypothetical protein